MQKILMSNNFENGPIPHITVDGVSAYVSTDSRNDISPTSPKSPLSYQRAVMESTISGLLKDLDFQSERCSFYRNENKKLVQDKANLVAELEKLSRLYGLLSAEKPDAEAAWKIIQQELIEVKGDYADLFVRYQRYKEKYDNLKAAYDSLQ